MTGPEKFRESLQDAVTLLRVLEPNCQSVDEIIEMAEFAQVNDGQLRMIMRAVDIHLEEQRKQAELKQAPRRAV